jgi:hypothetical protein
MYLGYGVAWSRVGLAKRNIARFFVLAPKYWAFRKSTASSKRLMYSLPDDACSERHGIGQAIAECARRSSTGPSWRGRQDAKPEEEFGLVTGEAAEDVVDLEEDGLEQEE